MNRRLFQSIAPALLPVMMFALTLVRPAILLGQDAVPPAPGLARSTPVWVGFGVMFIMVAIVVAISLMPSKRSHQD